MTRIFQLSKLVRDGIVPSMEAAGQKPDFRVLTEQERVSELYRKIIEEALEGDVADLLELAEAIGEAAGKSFDEIRADQLAKREKVGGFTQGIFVNTVTLEDGDKWIDYYAAEPDRFPEVQNGS